MVDAVKILEVSIEICQEDERDEATHKGPEGLNVVEGWWWLHPGTLHFLRHGTDRLGHFVHPTLVVIPDTPGTGIVHASTTVVLIY